jgi:chemotaxis protein CheD
MKNFINLPRIYLKPGEFYYSKKPEVVVTVLGSCIAIVMFSGKKNICLVSHSVLPLCSTYSKNFEGECNFRYVDYSIKKMLEIFTKLKIARDDINVKLFGGAEQLRNNRRNISIGMQNISLAMEILNKEKLKLISSDTGGYEGRKILIATHTGEVLLTRLSNQKIEAKR